MPQTKIAPPEPRRWLMFAILLVGAFLPPLDFFIVNVALPSIQQSLGTASSAEQLIISSYAALYAVTLITGGRLGDIYGRMRMFFLGLVGFAVASLICGVAESPWVLIAGRSLQGVTAAVMAPQALASAQAIFPESEKPLALSLYGAVFGLASVAGQALGGILISLDLMGLGWREIFLVNLPIALLVILIAIPVVRETRAQQTSKLDLGGTVLSMATLGALIVPLIEGREAGWPLWACLSLAAVPLLGWLFWRYEARLHQAQGSPVLGFVLLAWLVAHTPMAVTPPALPLAVILFLIGFGQGLALPTLMRMITGRVAPAYSGMIAGIASSTLQISTSLSVAIIGGIFYTLLGTDTDAAALTHAFTVSILCIAACLALGAGLSLSLARQPAAQLQTAALRPVE